MPKMGRAWAVRKASTTPEPGPTSKTSTASSEEVTNRDLRKAVSQAEDRGIEQEEGILSRLVHAVVRHMPRCRGLEAC